MTSPSSLQPSAADLKLADSILAMLYLPPSPAYAHAIAMAVRLHVIRETLPRVDLPAPASGATNPSTS